MVPGSTTNGHIYRGGDHLALQSHIGYHQFVALRGGRQERPCVSNQWICISVKRAGIRVLFVEPARQDLEMKLEIVASP